MEHYSSNNAPLRYALFCKRSEMPPRCVWAALVACAFLEHAPPAASFSQLASRVGLARAPPRVRTCARGAGLSLSFGEPDADAGAAADDCLEQPGGVEQGATRADVKAARVGTTKARAGLGPRATETRRRSQARRQCAPGEVFRVRPARDNSWHETRATTRRTSSFIYALMYSWPTAWLRAERTLGSYARALRSSPAEPTAVGSRSSADDSEKEDDEAHNAAAPFDVGPRFRVGLAPYARDPPAHCPCACVCVRRPEVQSRHTQHLKRARVPSPHARVRFACASMRICVRAFERVPTYTHLPAHAHILTPTPLTHARTNTPAQTLGGKAGKGAFSVVRSGRDLERESQVAIKRVQDATEDLTYLRRLLREVALLRRVRG